MLLIPGTKPIRFEMNHDDREDILNRKVVWNLPGISEFTFMRTYSRKKENGKLETWNECVVRVIEGMFTILKTYTKLNLIPWNEDKAQRFAKEAADRMFVFKWLPPGRGLWMMGTDFMWEKGSACLQNCGFVSTERMGENVQETVFPFTFLMDMMMVGSGIGFDTKGAGKLDIKGWDESKNEVFVVQDTRESWVESIGKIIEHCIYGKPRIWLDTRLVRSEGQPIRGFGGVSSGPMPLIQSANGIADLLNSRRGKTISSTDIVDVQNLIGKCVVAGNVRRGAEIAFADPEDEEFYTMKNFSSYPVETGAAPPPELMKASKEDYESYLAHMYTPSDGVCKNIVRKYENEIWAYKFGGWRWASNNSMFAKVGMKYDRFENSIRESGEPGFVWMDLIRSHGRLKDEANNADYRVMGTNPCVSGDTLILTKNGHVRIDSILNKETDVWNGFEWSSVVPKQTGSNQKLLNIEFSNGLELKCTPYHKFILNDGTRIEAKNLISGMKLLKSKRPVIEGTVEHKNAWIQGFYSGDGHDYRGENWLYLYDKKMNMISEFSQYYFVPESNRNRIRINLRNDMLAKDFVPSVDWTVKSRLEWLAGIIDSDGSSVFSDNSYCIQISSIDKQFLNKISLMLQTVGCQANVILSTPAKEKLMPDGKGGHKIYSCQNCYVLTISPWNVRQLQNLGLTLKRVNLDRNAPTRDSSRYVSIKSVIEIDGEHDVYCFNESLNHSGIFNGIITAQCGEQSMESYEMCNLVETFPVYHEDYWDFQRSLKYAFMYSKIVTLMGTHVDRTNAVIIRNRRIGCSMSGVADAIGKFGRTRFLAEFCDKAYDYIKYVDCKYSNWLGIRESIKKTTVKPSGTTSIVAGVSGPGMHFAKMKSGYRLIRVANNSDMVSVLKGAGYRVEPSVTDPMRTMVVYFPMLVNSKVLSEEETTIWEKFKMAADLQYYWSDNSVSCTIEFNKKEAENGEIVRCLEAFEGNLKVISLLPKMEGAYAQMPYTAAPREEIEEYIKQLQPLDFSELTNEGEDSGANLYCDSTSCTLK